MNSTYAFFWEFILCDNTHAFLCTSCARPKWRLRHPSNVAFFSLEHSLGLMINIDWFQPFKHRNYSVGVIYLTIVNLPRSIRFKRENVLVVGMIPGPSEPSLTVNSYLQPLVLDLLSLWKGVHLTDSTSKRRLIRCALMCIACDLPAARKVSGFLSYTANRGCSRCECTGHFGHQNYGGFDRNSLGSSHKQEAS